MVHYPIPDNESIRLKAVADLGIVGTPQEAAFDTLASLTRNIFNVPIALISLLDEHQQWFKAHPGLEACSTDRDVAFCNYPVASGQMLIVEDAMLDARFKDNPLVTGAPCIRFYAGIPLSIDPGIYLGTLCIVDTRSRRLTLNEAAQLCQLADLAADLMRQFKTKAALQQLHKKVVDQATKLSRQKILFDQASAIANLGAWEWDLADDKLIWTEGMYNMHDLPINSPISLEQVHAMYGPADRLKLEGLMLKSMSEKRGYVFEGPMKTASGRHLWIRLTAGVQCENGKVVRRYGVKQDVTEQRSIWDKMRFLSSCDSLTRLPNRATFHKQLEQRLAHSSPDAALALMMIDIDGFKHVNDTFGHSVGDECLKQIAKRLRSRCPKGGLVARWGGDEFALLLDGADPRAVTRCAQGILAIFRRPIRLRNQSAQLSASIGIAISDMAANPQPTELLKEADFAMYAAKAAGKNTLRHYLPQMIVKANKRFESIRNITTALARNQLELFYQPKVDLTQNDENAGFEALLRWRRPDGQIVTASAFGEAFSDPELSNRLGKWVMDQAFRQAREWMAAGLDFKHIAVNLSSGQFREPGLSMRLIRQLKEFGLPAEMIEVEVTESVFLDGEEDEVQKTLLDLRNAGIRIALDDFGTGFASLSHLRNFPVDILKIDRSFVQHFLTAPRDHAIVQATLFLARHMNLDVVAEGIELPEQCEFLKALGCRYGQGYLFAKALPAAEAAEWSLLGRNITSAA